MKTLIYKGKKYYIDGVSGDLKNKMTPIKIGGGTTFKRNFVDVIFGEDEPVFFYNHSKLGESEFALGDAIGALVDITQPSIHKVRGAMIWQTGYDGNMYSIKSGGETKSDSMYSSSLTTEIAHPKTGLDTEIVLIKKFSKNFKDVLITEKEIRDLYEMCMTPKQKKNKKNQTMLGATKMIIDIFEGHKVNISGREVIASKRQLDLIKKCLFESASHDEIMAHMDSLIQKRSRYLKVSLNEEQSSCTTKEFHEGIKKQVENLEKVKLSLMETELV